MANTICCLLLLGLLTHAKGQTVEILTSRPGVSIRGLSVVNDQVVWVSGSGGNIGQSTNGGKTWRWITVPGCEKRDFRDIVAFNERQAIIMAVAEPALILKTLDGGESWQKVFEDSTKGMFLDAMFFRDVEHGIVVGDPVTDGFFIRFSDDGGATWSRKPETPIRGAEGEACFAASGSNIWLDSVGRYFLVTGGTRSSLLCSSGNLTLPLNQGQASTGANSIASWKGMRFAVVGGDFSHDHDTTGNCALSFDGGLTWRKPTGSPHGYRSCVCYVGSNDLVCCGTTGVDISHDAGNHWTLVSPESFHVCSSSPSNQTIFLAGSGGRVARLHLE